MKSFVTFFLAAIIITLSGCSFFKNLKKKSTPVGEIEIFSDANAPAGYNPLYIKSVQSLDSLNSDAELTSKIFMTEVDSNKVKLYVDIIDKNGTFYIDGSKTEHKKIWCLLEDYSTLDSIAYEITDFVVKEETESMPISTAFVIVLDHSGSMGPSRAYQVQDAVINLINKKRDSDAFAIIKYDEKIMVEVPLSKDKDFILSNFRRNGLTGFGGYTAISSSISKAVELLQDVSGYDRKCIIVFTDGLENSSTISKSEAINTAIKNKIPVFTADFGGSTDPVFMATIADSTGGYYYHTYHSYEFDKMFRDSYMRTINRYIIEFTPRGFGERKLKLKLCINDTTIANEKTINYQPVVGASINLAINFDSGKSIIKAEYNDDLDYVVDMLKKYPGMKIEISGHTDNVGSESLNLKLSQTRADAVKKYLVDKNITADRLTSVGYGESIPISDNTTDEGKKRNRRTEIKILSL